MIYKVAVTDDRYGTYEIEKNVLKEIDAEVTVYNCKTAEEVIDACRDADGIMVNLAPMPGEVIEKLDKCRVISRYGVGYDNVDAAACTAKGIQLTNVSDYCMEEVSDHALALLLSCARKTARRDAQVRQGRWNVGSADPIYRISGKVFAFLGFGTIARCLNRKIKGLGFSRVLVYDPFIDEKTINEAGCEKADWEAALGKSDFISVHMPLNEKTRGIIDEKAFGLMKPGTILINTSRGPVINENALIEALKKGIINSAGLDVHRKEPLEADNPLLRIENCVLTDHVGWYSEESVEELKRKVAENVRDALLGRPPRYPINKIT